MRILILVLLVSSSALAATAQDGLNSYLQAKSIKCSLTEEQFNTQITAHIDRNVQQISDTLRARGSEFKSIDQDRDHVQVGTFPGVSGFDFYVLEKVTIVIGNFNFQIQTTYATEGSNTPTVAQGLWFPLAVKDTGMDQPCQLERVSVSEDQRKFLPSVDMVIGDSANVVASRLADVMDVTQAPSSQETPQVNKKAAPKEEPRVKSKPSSNDEEDRKPSRRELRRERRERAHHYRRHERRERRSYRRHRRVREDDPAPKTAEPPPQDNGCSGDISPWKSALCTITGKK